MMIAIIALSCANAQEAEAEAEAPEDVSEQLSELTESVQALATQQQQLNDFVVEAHPELAKAMEEDAAEDAAEDATEEDTEDAEETEEAEPAE